MLLLAGLGNPGSRYENHRHNVGYLAANAIARRHSFSAWSRKFQALVAEGRIGDEKIVLIKPQTFMNLSGSLSARRCASTSSRRPTSPYSTMNSISAPGKVRIKVGGGAGGHNGIRSIDGHVGQDYRRVRIGIGHPGIKEMVTHHVLGDFAKADHEWLDPLLDAIADNADLLAKGDDSGFMNKLALAIPRQAKDDPVSPPREQSHVRQARPKEPAAKLPETGPMAAMLRRLLGNKN